MPPKPHGDNPDAIGPAGTVHCSIEDWAKFAHFHLEAKPGPVLKKMESFEMLHKAHHEKSRYCLGWIEAGEALAHDGSNTMWYASIKLMPEQKAAALVCVNAGGKAATELCNEVIKWLAE